MRIRKNEKDSSYSISGTIAIRKVEKSNAECCTATCTIAIHGKTADDTRRDRGRYTKTIHGNTVKPYGIRTRHGKSISKYCNIYVLSIIVFCNSYVYMYEKRCNLLVQIVDAAAIVARRTSLQRHHATIAQSSGVSFSTKPALHIPNRP